MSTRDMPDSTRWWRERPVETLEFNYHDTMAILEVVDVFNLPNHDVTIQRIVISSETPDIGLYIRMFTDAGEWTDRIMVTDADGSAKWTPSIKKVYQHTSDIFDILVYDTVNDRYKLALSRQLRCANGLMIQFGNASGALANVAVECSVLDRGIIP